MKNIKSNVKPTNLDLDVFSIEELPPEGNLQLPTPELVTKYKFLKDRRLFITQDIDDSIMEFTKNLIMWNMEDEQNNIPIEERKPVYIYILSYGGQLDQIMTLIDVINIQCRMNTSFILASKGIRLDIYVKLKGLLKI